MTRRCAGPKSAQHGHRCVIDVVWRVAQEAYLADAAQALRSQGMVSQNYGTPPDNTASGGPVPPGDITTLHACLMLLCQNMAAAAPACALNPTSFSAWRCIRWQRMSVDKAEQVARLQHTLLSAFKQILRHIHCSLPQDYLSAVNTLLSWFPTTARPAVLE